MIHFTIPRIALAMVTAVLLLAAGCGDAAPVTAERDAAGEAGQRVAGSAPGDVTTLTAVDPPATESFPLEGAELESLEGFIENPTNTDVRLIGGSYHAGDVRLDRLPDVAELAVTGTIVDIRPGRFNTPTGDWRPPQELSAEELHNAFADLLVYTDVVIVVDGVAGARPEQANATAAGQQIILTLLGGAQTATFTPAQANAIGLDAGLEAEGPAPKPVDEGAPVTEPLTLTSQMDFAVSLAEGDRVLAFLSQGTIRHAYGEGTERPWFSVLPQGAAAFRLDASDPATAFSATTGRPFDVAALMNAAAGLRDRQGDARRPNSAADFVESGY